MVGISGSRKRPSWVVPRDCASVSRPRSGREFCFLEKTMKNEIVFQATPPSKGYIVSMTGVALAGSIGLPFMLWLIFTNIFLHKWLMVGVCLFAGLICAGMALMWKAVRAGLRQRRDRSLHEIRIDGQKFVYRREDLVKEVPLADILGVRDRVEASAGSQPWTVEIVHKKDDGTTSQFWINSVDFADAWGKVKGRFGAVLWEAILANRNQ